MATYQTDYTSAPRKGLPGQVANEEKCNKVSRSIESAAGLAFGQPAFRGAGDHGVIAGAAFAATAAAAAAAGNTGNGTITASPLVAAPAKQGRYVATALSNAAFLLVDPDGVDLGEFDVGAAGTLGGIGPATITAGGTPFAAGDQFYIDVTYTADAIFLGLAVLNPAVPAVAAGSTLVDGYPQGFTAAIMTDGQMYNLADATVKPGDPVFWNPTTKRFSNVVTGGNIKLPRVTFDTSGVAGDIVEMSLKHR